MKKNKKLILSIVSVIAIAALGTFAWIIWNSPNNTEMTMEVGELAEVSFRTGNDISASNMGPVLNPDVDGEITTFSINNKSDKTYDIEVSLNIVSIASQLQVGSFKYKLLSSSTQNGTYTSIANGTFENIAAGKNILLETTIASSTKTYYKFIMYIDGTMENDPSMMNKSISGTLDVSASHILLADKVIELAGNCTSWSSGFSGLCATNSYDDNGVTKYHEYRYVGVDPNNYVKFNDDIYRIIGVFDDYSHGVTGEYLVKLIASRSIASYTWGTTNSSPDYTTYSEYNNNWETANTNILLNEYYLNAADTSTTYSSCSNWTYYYSYYNGDHKLVYKTYDCSDIVGYGIQTNTLRNYIQPVTWYLKGRTSTSSKQNFYTCERSNTKTISGCGNGTGGLTKIQDKYIGLMYASDYLYASGYYASTDTTDSSQLYYGQQNWLYKGYEWTITPNSSQNASTFRVYNGSLTSDTTGAPYAIRPSFYLKSTTRIKLGDGTFNNPYIIG